MTKTNLIQLTTYIEPNDIPKIIKKRGSRSMISWSAYLRFLVERDIGKASSDDFK